MVVKWRYLGTNQPHFHLNNLQLKEIVTKFIVQNNSHISYFKIFLLNKIIFIKWFMGKKNIFRVFLSFFCWHVSVFKFKSVLQTNKVFTEILKII